MSGWPYATLESANAVGTADRAATSGSSDELAEREELLAHRQAVRRARTSRLATGLAGLAFLVVAWQLAAMLLGDQVALPTVTQTVQQFAHYLARPYPAQGKPIWFDLYITLRRILIGFLVGVIIGVAVGALMSTWRFGRHLIDPVIEVIRPLPPLAFIPLFIVWLGIGELPKEVLIIVGVIPVMAVTTVAALDAVPEDLRLCARTLGATASTITRALAATSSSARICAFCTLRRSCRIPARWTSCGWCRCRPGRCGYATRARRTASGCSGSSRRSAGVSAAGWAASLTACSSCARLPFRRLQPARRRQVTGALKRVDG